MNHDDLTELQQDLDNANMLSSWQEPVFLHTQVSPITAQNGIYNGVQESRDDFKWKYTL